MKLLRTYWFFILVFALIVYYFYKAAKAPKITYSPQLIMTPSGLDPGILSNLANVTNQMVANASHTTNPKV